jgi:hypothetical protein
MNDSTAGHLEQNLHRDVVARQLETLVALREQPNAAEPGLVLHNSYIRPAAAADAGAGTYSTNASSLGDHHFS